VTNSRGDPIVYSYEPRQMEEAASIEVRFANMPIEIGNSASTQQPGKFKFCRDPGEFEADNTRSQQDNSYGGDFERIEERYNQSVQAYYQAAQAYVEKYNATFPSMAVGLAEGWRNDFVGYLKATLSVVELAPFKFEVEHLGWQMNQDLQEFAIRKFEAWHADHNSH